MVAVGIVTGGQTLKVSGKLCQGTWIGCDKRDHERTEGYLRNPWKRSRCGERIKSCVLEL